MRYDPAALLPPLGTAGYPPRITNLDQIVAHMSYHVQLELFEGPLDLLLYLVRRNEVNVCDLPLGRITTQFTELIEVLEFIDIDLAGEFVVVASALVEIKSRLALPRPAEEEAPAEVADDSSNDLIHKLLEYKKYKEAASALEEQAAAWQDRYPRLSTDRPSTGKTPSADRIKEVELWDLVSALSRVLRRKEVQKQSRIRYDDTPISVYIERVRARVGAEGRTAFSSFFERTNERSKIVGLFLAILELIRHHAFRCEQPVECGEIFILPPSGADVEAKDGTGHAFESDALTSVENELPRLLSEAEQDEPPA